MPAVHSRIVFPAIAELEGAPSTVLPSPPTLALQFSNGNATGELACGISVGDVSAFSDARGLVQDFNAPVPPLSLNGSPGPKNIIIHLSVRPPPSTESFSDTQLSYQWPGLHSYTSSRHNVSLFKNNNRICMGELAGRVCQLVAGFLRVRIGCSPTAVSNSPLRTTAALWNTQASRSATPVSQPRLVLGSATSSFLA